MWMVGVAHDVWRRHVRARYERRRVGISRPVRRVGVHLGRSDDGDFRAV